MARAIVDLKLELAVGIEGYALMRLDEKIEETVGFVPSNDLLFTLEDIQQSGIDEWVKSNIDHIPKEVGIYNIQGKGEFTEDSADYSLTCIVDTSVPFKAKRKECHLNCIQWTGKNLADVLDFTGKTEKFDEWFKSFEEFEKYVLKDDSIFKIFYCSGGHKKVHVGDFLVKDKYGSIEVVNKARFKSEFEQARPH